MCILLNTKTTTNIRIHQNAMRICMGHFKPEIYYDCNKEEQVLFKTLRTNLFTQCFVHFFVTFVCMDKSY